MLAGCSAAPSQASSRPAPATAAPAGGQLLRDRGITNGPAHFALPAGVQALRTIDQPNVVTLVFGVEDGRKVLDYLLLHGAALGMTQLRTGNQSATFEVDGWDGGFTISSEISGLTLRRQA